MLICELTFVFVQHFLPLVISADATVGRYADVALDIETARLLVFNAARLKETGQPFIKEV